MASIPDNFAIHVGIVKQTDQLGRFVEHYFTIELPLTRTKHEAYEVFEDVCKRFDRKSYDIRLVKVSCRSAELEARPVDGAHAWPA